MRLTGTIMATALLGASALAHADDASKPDHSADNHAPIVTASGSVSANAPDKRTAGDPSADTSPSVSPVPKSLDNNPVPDASRTLPSAFRPAHLDKRTLAYIRAVTGKQDKPQAPTKAPVQAPAPASPPSRALDSPLDNPPYPFTDWTINSGYPIGESWDSPVGPLQHALVGTKLDNTHWRFGGWLDVGTQYSNARNTNLPDSYELVPKHIELDQLVFVAQKMVDTVQKRYVDWGFYSAQLVGIDYRFTSAKGVLDDQLLSHNNLYGYDPVLQWGEVYFPKIADGAVLQFGRYISPIDIEAQLSNSNYLYTHSIMFGVDPYTYTGINMQVRVNKEFEYMVGIHAGNENTPWSGAADANGEFLIGWSSADGKDSLWGGLDSIGGGHSIRGHDNEQIINFVWGHKFNKRWHMQTQGYYMWEYDALVGGTPINGPSYPYSGSGAGAPIPGKAYAIGYVNYLEYQVNKNDYISFRTGYLNDKQGWRTGTATQYSDVTLGYSHLFAKYFWIRPEIRWDHSYDADGFDAGTKNNLYSISGDLITRF